MGGEQGRETETLRRLRTIKSIARNGRPFVRIVAFQRVGNGHQRYRCRSAFFEPLRHAPDERR
jgi:hypothetical protein